MGKSADIDGTACGTKEGISSVFLKCATLPAATRNGPSKGRYQLLDKIMSLGHAVGCGTALQSVRSRFQVPMVSLECFIDIWPRNISPGVKAVGA